MRPRLTTAALALLAMALTVGATWPAPRPPGEVVLTYGSTEEPVTIERTPWGVPHVSADSTVAASYGLGYAAAQDRLWTILFLIDYVSGESRAGLLGPVVHAEQRIFVRDGYTVEERRAIFERLPAHVQDEVQAYVDGVNTYIDEANLDPSKMPSAVVEFGAYPVAHIAVEDVMAWYYGVNTAVTGGVPIMDNFNLLQRLVSSYGEEEGRRKFDDLHPATDVDTATTMPRGMPYRHRPTGAPSGVEALRQHAEDARSLDASATGSAVEHGRPTASAVDALRSVPPDVRLPAETGDPAPLPLKLLGSNFQLVAPKLSATGNALLLGGPQTSYTVPSLYWEAGVHVPGVWETTGMTIPPMNYFLVGRGPGYAWSLANGQQGDLSDLFTIRLDPADPRRYLFNGTSEPMTCRDHVYTVGAVPYETQQICRTHHGPVVSFDEPNGIAFALRHAWFGREDLTVRAFRSLNTARSFADYAEGAALMPSSVNLGYADDEGRIAWWYTGLHPRRAPGADVRLPVDGTGAAEWQGVVPFDELPHVVDPVRGWIATWNTYPAEDWRSGRIPYYAARVEKVTRPFTVPGYPDPLGGSVNSDDRWDPSELVASNRVGAYGDDGWIYLAALPTADELDSELAMEALEVARSWDGLAIDRDGDGLLDHAGATILRQWQGTARHSIFADDLPAGDTWRAHDYGTLWRVLSPEATQPLAFDWLDGEAREAVAARTFEQAVAELSAAFEGSDDPSTWLAAKPWTNYIHLNHHLALDLGDSVSCGASGPCLRAARAPSGDVRAPGYVHSHHHMDRGSYTQIVGYLDAPSRRGAAPVSACGVLAPGNGGTVVNMLGQEDPHFADQRELYIGWEFHDHALRAEEIDAAMAGGTCDPAAVQGEATPGRRR